MHQLNLQTELIEVFLELKSKTRYYMMNSEAEKSRKVYFSIGEVASAMGVSTSLLRFWENEFPHIRPQTNKKGERRYRQADIDAIKQIHTLVKERGYTLQGAKEYLNSNRANQNIELVSGLIRLKEFLLEVKSRLPE